MPRTAYPELCHPDGDGAVSFPPREIRFLHPGYPIGRQLLLILPATDERDSPSRNSMAILRHSRGNSLDGFLSEDQEGQRRLSPFGKTAV